MLATIPAGHTAVSLVASLDCTKLFLCERFNDRVMIVDLARHAGPVRIAVPRQPISLDVTPDGKHLRSGPSPPRWGCGPRLVGRFRERDRPCEG